MPLKNVLWFNDLGKERDYKLKPLIFLNFLNCYFLL